MGLRKELNEEIKLEGYLSYDGMEEICKEMGHRTDFGRRCLEPDQSPNVKKEKGKTKRGVEFIKGWRYNPKDELKEYREAKLTRQDTLL